MTSIIGSSLFKKAKDLFTTNEDDEIDTEYAAMTQNHFLWVSALEFKTKEVLNHVAVEEIGKLGIEIKIKTFVIVPILTFQAFHTLCTEKFNLNLMEK